MANKLGFYLQSFEIGEHKQALFDAIRDVQPPTILVHAWDQVDTLRRLAPHAFIIGRMTYFGPEKTPLEKLTEGWLNDPHPEDRGRDLAQHILTDNFEAARKCEGDRLRIDAWMSLNEVVPGPNSKDFAEDPQKITRRLKAYDAFQVGFRNKLMEHGIEAVAFNFGAGNFITAKQYLDHFPQTLASYNYLGFHEYGWPALSTAVDPTAVTSGGAYRGIVAGLRQALHRDFKAILTEAGLTFMHKFAKSGFDEGWLFVPPAEFHAAPLTQDQYWRSLDWLNTTLVQDPFALGACLYEVGHAGKWINFRHFGQDNSGQPITLMERIRSLAQAAPQADALALEGIARPPQDFTGHVVDQDGAPISGAMLRLAADLATLGADPRAVTNSRGAVMWTRELTGFHGSLRECWDKHVAKQVAGLTFEEFRRQAAEYNPSLRASDDRMLAGERYFLPENRLTGDTAATAPDVVWDRVLTDYDGDLPACWRRNVQGKVIGLTWDAFRRLVRQHNPGLLSRQKAAGQPQTIVLPRNGNQDDYVRVAFSDARGRFRFDELPAGAYRFETTAAGYVPDTRDLTAPAAGKVVIGLHAPALPVVEEGAGEEEALAIPAAGGFVTRVGREFALNGQRFRFIGFNLRGLVHYGRQRPVETANARDQLARARGFGARVIRVFAPHKDVSPADTVNRLRDLINLMDAEFPDMYLIVCLANLYSDVDFRVPGDNEDVYDLQPGGQGAHILGHNWFQGGYKNAYLPFVKTVVSAFRDAPRIMAYNIGNELKAEERADLLVDFMLAAAAQIRGFDSGNHLITTGMISTRHAFMEGNDALRMKLYGSPNLDFITNHAYHGDRPEAPSIEDDSDLSMRLAKPLLIEEAGFVGQNDRSRLYEQDLVRLLDEKQASGFMPWGFMAGHNNGDGDDALGIDDHFHGADFNRLGDIFRERADRLARDNAVLSAPKPAAAKFTVGQTVFTQRNANMRKTPGLAGAFLQEVEARTPVLITGDAQRTPDSLLWWPVKVTNVDGFIAQANQSNVALLGPA